MKGSPEVIVEYVYRDEGDESWIDVYVDRQIYAQLGPFDSAAAREKVKVDMLETMRSMGAKDMPVHRQ